MELLQVSMKLVVGFILLYLFVRILGKKLIDQMTPFHFIAAIVLSELLGNAVYDKNIPITHILFTILIWGGLLFSIDYLAQKSRLLRKIFEGKPTMVIEHGQINYEQLKKSRMNINQLQGLLRQSEVFSIREVEFAFIEANGSISVLKKSPYQKTTLQDFNLPNQPVYLPITLIRDGELIQENLQEIDKDIHWLKNQLQANGVNLIENVLLAEWLKNDGLYVIPYQQASTVKSEKV